MNTKQQTVTKLKNIATCTSSIFIVFLLSLFVKHSTSYSSIIFNSGEIGQDGKDLYESGIFSYVKDPIGESLKDSKAIVHSFYFGVGVNIITSSPSSYGAVFRLGTEMRYLWLYTAIEADGYIFGAVNISTVGGGGGGTLKLGLSFARHSVAIYGMFTMQNTVNAIPSSDCSCIDANGNKINSGYLLQTQSLLHAAPGGGIKVQIINHLSFFAEVKVLLNVHTITGVAPSGVFGGANILLGVDFNF